MNSDYSLGGDMVGVSGGVHPPAFYDNMARKLVGAHYNLALAIIILLAIIIVVMLVKKERFMPTALMREQKLDGLGEGMSGGSNQKVLNVPGSSITYNPNAVSGQQGSLNWSVLNDPNLDCANNANATAGTSAWSWMQSNIGPAEPAATGSEGMASTKGYSDNALSYVMNH